VKRKKKEEKKEKEVFSDEATRRQLRRGKQEQ